MIVTKEFTVLTMELRLGCWESFARLDLGGNISPFNRSQLVGRS